MTVAEIKRPIPRYALDRTEAAASLGMSVDHFTEHVQPHVRVIRSGRKRLFPAKDLERWADENAAMTLGSSA